MKKRCPNCNKYTFNYWELFFPYPIKDSTTTCKNCSALVFPREILTLIPMYIFYIFLALAIAFHSVLGEIEGQRYYDTFKLFFILLAILSFARFLDIRLFDLAINKKYKDKIQAKAPIHGIEQNYVDRLAYTITLLWCGILIFYVDYLFTSFNEWLNNIFTHENYADTFFMLGFMLTAIIPYLFIKVFLRIKGGNKKIKNTLSRK